MKSLPAIPRSQLSARAARSAVTLALLLTAVAPAAASEPAHAARTLSVKDEGHLKLVHSSGSLLIDEGPASGTLPGRTRVQFVYKGEPTVSATITVFGHAGSVTAHGNGRLSSPTSVSPSFSGTLTITGGSGRYAGARGAGRLYGVFNRRTYAM
ncbi:MAG TPA: hypothetical protein VK774_01535, partial [Solirubrobacteraceae bacterium]|nr:hypothetical protein [Solirubrobacteraceae bacterium]